jgi:hypothetical protein
LPACFAHIQADPENAIHHSAYRLSVVLERRDPQSTGSDPRALLRVKDGRKQEQARSKHGKSHDGVDPIAGRYAAASARFGLHQYLVADMMGAIA